MRIVDLIRSQQKGKSVTPRAKKSAPRKADQEEPELTRGEEHPPGPTEDAWKAQLVNPPAVPEEPAIFAPGNPEPSGLYAAAEEILRPIFNSARRRDPFAIKPAAEIAEQLAKASAKENLSRAIKDSSRRSPTLMLQTLESDPEKPNLVRHSLNVAIYALKLGDELSYPLSKLTELALAGMLYDIGLTWVPEALLKNHGALSDSERDLINNHPLNSYEILRPLGGNWEWLAGVALQHHESEDGSGYPKGLLGDQIHEYAKIIGICDIYEAMAHGRAQRQGLAPFEAVKEIVQTERSRFSQVILRAFINGISSYPVGSWLRLSSKEIGQVIATNKGHPLRPVVEVWYDPHGAKLPQPKVIDLTKEALLHITGPATEGAGTE